MVNMNIGPSRVMSSDIAGVRPSKDRNKPSSLKEREVFINLTDLVMCVGSGGGDHKEIYFSNKTGEQDSKEDIGDIAQFFITQLK